MKTKSESKAINVAWIILLSVDTILNIVKIVKRARGLASLTRKPE